MLEYKKKCFVIMPISDAEGYDKGHFTRVYEHLIKPAVIAAIFLLKNTENVIATMQSALGKHCCLQ